MFAADGRFGRSLRSHFQDGHTYQIVSITTAANIQNCDGVFRNTIGSFQRVTDPRLLNVKPQKLRIVKLPSAMTLTQFNQQYPSVIPMAQLSIINALDPGAMIPAGTLVKRVIAE